MTDVPSPAPRAHSNLPMVIAAVVGGGLVAIATGMWIVYGGAIFFDLVAAGLSACF